MSAGLGGSAPGLLSPCLVDGHLLSVPSDAFPLNVSLHPHDPFLQGHSRMQAGPRLMPSFELDYLYRDPTPNKIAF